MINIIRLKGPTFAQRFPGAKHYAHGEVTPEFRAYTNQCIAAGKEAIRRSVMHDAAPEPDPDPKQFFNGVPYAEGKRRYEEHQAKRGKKPGAAVMRDSKEESVESLICKAVRQMYKF